MSYYIKSNSFFHSSNITFQHGLQAHLRITKSWNILKSGSWICNNSRTAISTTSFSFYVDSKTESRIVTRELSIISPLIVLHSRPSFDYHRGCACYHFLLSVSFLNMLKFHYANIKISINLMGNLYVGKVFCTYNPHHATKSQISLTLHVNLSPE
jgi:hypothetical protein